MGRMDCKEEKLKYGNMVERLFTIFQMCDDSIGVG